jgi:hypothetical protein
MPGHPPYALHFLTLPSSLLLSKNTFFANAKNELKNLFGGGERDRTDDPLLAKQVLSQLSYTPT